MVKKTLLISGAVLGALAIGSQSVSADTVEVNDGTETTTSQPAAQSVESDSGSVTLPAADSQSDSSADNNVDSNLQTPSTENSASVDDGTTVDNSDQTVVTDDTTGQSGSSSSTNSEETTEPNSSTENIDTENASIESNTSNSQVSSDESSTVVNDDVLPTNGKTPEIVPLTATTPDVNENGQLNQVTPVAVQQPVQGQAPVVPEQVATVPSVARAVQAYNETLATNNNDATQTSVVDAKKKVEEAVQKALPKTGVREQKSGVGVIGALLAALASGLAFIFKKKQA